MVEKPETAITATARLAHYPENFGAGAPVAVRRTRRPALVLSAEGPRRADLLAWAGAHRDKLAGLRLLAPPGVSTLLTEQVGLTSEPLRSGTMGPAATAGLAAAGVIDGVVAFSDPIELRPGDTTTRSLMRLAVFWDIPYAGNRATADIMLAKLLTDEAFGYTEAVGESTELTAGAGGARPAPPTGAVRLWHIRATVEDVPGRLAVLAASLARRAINILSVQVHLTADGPVDDLLVSASSVLSAHDLAAAVTDGGARAPRVSPADAHALVDPPTRALGLAARLLRSTDDLPEVLTTLLGGAEIAWRPEPPSGYADDPTQMWLPDPAGGGFLLSRPLAPFTPTESARASTMIEVAMTAALAAVRPEPEPDAVRLLLADGDEVVVRRAVPEDAEAVIALHARCSLTSRLRRYLAGTSVPPADVLARLLAPGAGHTLVVEDDRGQIVAMGNLMWTSADSGTAELALLVEDAWQGRRIGTALARKLARAAAANGVRTVQSLVHAANTPMTRIMSKIGHRLHREYDAGVLTLIATLEEPGRLPGAPLRGSLPRGA